MQNSEGHSGRYAWTRVKTNRHKTNKRRDVSDAHLVGRLALLELDLKELGDRFPTISAKIEAEMAMISDEIALRASGKSKPSLIVPEWEPEYEMGDFESLSAVSELTIVENWEDECEI